MVSRKPVFGAVCFVRMMMLVFSARIKRRIRTNETSVWKLNPIKVDGQHFYDSVTNKPFYAAGVAFPNDLGDDVATYIAILKNIGKHFKGKVNVIRLYELPACIWNDLHGWCFRPFFQEADKQGIYVLLPGTGSFSGYIPRDGWKTLQECYSQGKPLNMGRGLVQRCNYPNTLGIFLGNEFLLGPDTYRGLGVFKSYARDMKKYMKMCNEDPSSPSKGKMREIPLLYAARDLGDAIDRQAMSYLMCDSAEVSIDAYGLNVERWCDPVQHNAYDSIEQWLKEDNNPGAFMFSEMGCPQNLVSSAPEGQACFTLPTIDGELCPRNWNQVDYIPDHLSMINGFSAYAYWNLAATNFNMVDSKNPDAVLQDDGKNLAAALQKMTIPETRTASAGQRKPCGTMLGQQKLEDYTTTLAYDDDLFPAKECPAPLSS